MKTFKLRAALIAALLAGAALSAAADSKSINYSGRLRPVSGAAFTGKETVTMTFRLYDQPTGGDVLWGRRYQVAVETNGTFKVVLSYGKDGGESVKGAHYENLPDALACGGKLYLGLVPDDREDSVDREFKPRQQLGGSVAAERAEVANSADELNMSAHMINMVEGGRVDCQGAMTTGVCMVTGALELSGGARMTYAPPASSVLVVSNGTFQAGRDMIRFKELDERNFVRYDGERRETVWWTKGLSNPGPEKLVFSAQGERSVETVEKAVPGVYGARVNYQPDSVKRGLEPRLPTRLGTHFVQPGESVDYSWNKQSLGVRE